MAEQEHAATALRKLLANIRNPEPSARSVMFIAVCLRLMFRTIGNLSLAIMALCRTYRWQRYLSIGGTYLSQPIVTTISYFNSYRIVQGVRFFW